MDKQGSKTLGQELRDIHVKWLENNIHEPELSLVYDLNDLDEIADRIDTAIKEAYERGVKDGRAGQ